MRTLGLLFAMTLPASAGLLPAERPPVEPICGQTEGSVCIPVAARDLEVGSILEASDLRMIEFPANLVAENALRSAEAIVGRTLRERILVDEIVREERLTDPDRPGCGLEALLPWGYERVHLSVRPANLSIIAPGNYVDVLVSVAGAKGLETATLLQGVSVLAIDRARAEATLVVTPEQRAALDHASERISVTLTLRSDPDITHIETHGTLGVLPKDAMTAREWFARTRPRQYATFGCL